MLGRTINLFTDEIRFFLISVHPGAIAHLHLAMILLSSENLLKRRSGTASCACNQPE